MDKIMSDAELIKTARQAMADLWFYNDGKFFDYEQSAYNCLRLLCIRLETELENKKEQ